MIHHPVTQGSPEWHALRLGIPTASNFHKIVTPTGKFSTQSRTYAYWLIAEKLLGRSLEPLTGIEWMERGKELEPEAVRMYEFSEDVATEPCGFITTDDGQIGASPDRLIIGKAAATEIKCPAPQTHVAYMIEGFGNDYVPQVQGQMYVGDFERVDRFSYHPEMPPVLLRTDRDEVWMNLLDVALRQFNDTKHEMEQKIRASGYFEERLRLRTAVDEAAAQEMRDAE